MNNVKEIVEKLNLLPHPEGGYFAEYYTSKETYTTGNRERPLAGSIYYLLDKTDISLFHDIDCDEIWYYHDGCGMNIYLLYPDGHSEIRKLGKDILNGEEPYVLVESGVIFAADNIDKSGATLISCMTAPNFEYEGWRIVGREELLAKYPQEKDIIELFTQD